MFPDSSIPVPRPGGRGRGNAIEQQMDRTITYNNRRFIEVPMGSDEEMINPRYHKIEINIYKNKIAAINIK